MGSNGTVVEEQEIPTYAFSLLVPNVQEIVREEPLNVSQRYIRDQEKMLKSTDKIHLSSEIPVNDLSMLSNANKEELKKLYLASQGVDASIALELLSHLFQADHVLGISPHTDTSTISILLQEDNINGLQIWHDGEWVPVNPIPNVLVVNIGDVIEAVLPLDREYWVLSLLFDLFLGLLQIWSNVKYNSIQHRAVTNENKCRLSFASFIVPHDDVEVEPFAHIVESHGSKRIYKKFSMKAASGGSGRSVTKYIAMWSIDFTRSIISHNSTG
ncbi:hypothetical protein LguiA_032166 [Lonicera macranthoides]